MTQTKKLTDVEYEIMQILWRLAGAGVNDVLAALPKERKLAYTSVSTMLRILEQKQFVKPEKVERRHIYMPIISKEDYQHIAVEKFITRIFDGKPSELVSYLLDSTTLTPEEIAGIKTLLHEKLSQNHD